MSNYKVAKDLEGQVLTLIEAIVPELERAEAAKSIFRRLFHEWVQRLDVGMVGNGSEPCTTAIQEKCCVACRPNAGLGSLACAYCVCHQKDDKGKEYWDGSIKK